MSLGTEVGLGPDDTVLDGDPAPTPSSTRSKFWPISMWPNGGPSEQLLSSKTC